MGKSLLLGIKKAFNVDTLISKIHGFPPLSNTFMNQTRTSHIGILSIARHQQRDFETSTGRIARRPSARSVSCSLRNG